MAALPQIRLGKANMRTLMRFTKVISGLRIVIGPRCRAVHSLSRAKRCDCVRIELRCARSIEMGRRGNAALPAFGLFPLMWMLAVTGAHAATVLSGNVSGTWTTNGGPYILSADCTVASNQMLTIEPGVEVIELCNPTRR